MIFHRAGVILIINWPNWALAQRPVLVPTFFFLSSSFFLSFFLLHMIFEIPVLFAFWHDIAWLCLAQLGSAWLSLAQLGSAWLSLAQLGSAWLLSGILSPNLASFSPKPFGHVLFSAESFLTHEYCNLTRVWSRLDWKKILISQKVLRIPFLKNAASSCLAFVVRCCKM